ncbi:MAG TPA: MerR family transcriptional regulator [Acidimicrobiales bacterium]
MSAATSPHAAEAYTVDEVADLTGTSVRTIRWYQSEGLVPPPRRDGRVARYSSEHVARLEVIRDLQAHGLTLTAVRRLLDRAPDSAAATALAFVQAAVSHSRDRDDVEVVDAVDGSARLGVRPSDRTAGELESLGIIEVQPDGRWRILAPAAFSAAQELAALGVPAERRLEVTQQLRAHTEAMAEVVTELFVEHLWRPSTRGDQDPDWVALTSAIARLRPLATTTVAAFFDDALGRAAEAAAARELHGDGG